MEPQIIQYNRMIHTKEYEQAENYHNGIKYGEYYRLWKRTQRSLLKFDTIFTSLADKLKRQRFAKSTEFTTESH